MYKASFIGIPFPKEMKEEFNQLLLSLKNLVPYLDTTKSKTPHLTLVFLGEQSEENLKEIKDKIKNDLSGGEVTIKEFGFFSNYNLVLFLKANLSPEITDMQKKIAKSTESYLSQTDNKPFVPHLTLGRIRNQDAIDDFFDTRIKEKVAVFLNKVDWNFEAEQIAIYGVDENDTSAGQQILHEIKIK